MTTIAEVRTDLALVLSNIPGWSVANLNGTASGYIGDQLNTYSFKVGRPAFDPRMVLSQAKAQHTFTVTAYAPRATPEVSEAALDGLCELTGEGSLIATVQDGDNWSVTVDYAQVTQCGEVQVATWIDGVEYLACQFQIEVVW
jgi:hypothetical protein